MSRPRRILDPGSLSFVLDALPDARPAYEVCGYLTALVTAPTHVLQEDWMVDVLGEDYADSDAAGDAVEAVFAFYQDIHERLVRGHSVAPPAELEAVIAWSRGYADAADADPTWCNDSAGARLVGMIEDTALTLEATLGIDDDGVPAAGDEADGDEADAPSADDEADHDNVVHLPPPHVALVTDEITDEGDDDDASGADDAEFGLGPEDLADMAAELDDFARLAFIYWRDARGKRTVDAQPLLPNPTPVRAEAKVPRNAPCPCGSGKKYKRCCGLDG